MEQLLRLMRARPIWVVLVTLTTVLLAGLSGLVYPSTYSPLYVLVLLAVLAVALLWLWKPSWALYTAIFIVFLPAGLIPANIQSTLNRSMTMVALAIWLFDIIIHRTKIVLGSAAILMLGFITWSLLTMLWAQNFDTGKLILQVYIMRFLLFLLLIPNQIRTLQKVNGLFLTMALSGWLFLLVSLATLIQNGFTSGVRFKVYDVNENEAGIFTLVMMVGVLWLASQASKRRKPVATVLACTYIIMSIGFTALSGSRGSALSLVISLLCFLLWRPSRPWGIFGLLVLLVGITVQPTLFITTLQRFTSTTDTVLGGREVLWLAGLRLISEHPIGGVGIGGSSYTILPYLGIFLSDPGPNGVSLHNPILVVWSETGLVGIILYLGVLVSAAYSFVRQYFRYKKFDFHGKFTPYFALVSSVFLGYMISWIKGGGMQTGYTFFLLIALLLIPSGLDASVVSGEDEL